MANKKRKISLNEVGYRLTEVWDDFQNGIIDDKKAMVNVKVGMAITNTFRTKALVNELNGIKSSIDDLWGDATQKIEPKESHKLIP